jgi:hypothetical protein
MRRDTVEHVLQGCLVRTKQAQGDWPKRHEPNLFVFGDAHQFSYQGLAHKDQPTAPLDLAVGADPPHLSQRGIAPVFHPLGIGARRWPIEGSRG